jgi:hypothetical protein
MRQRASHVFGKNGDSWSEERCASAHVSKYNFHMWIFAFLARYNKVSGRFKRLVWDLQFSVTIISANDFVYRRHPFSTDLGDGNPKECMWVRC